MTSYTAKYLLQRPSIKIIILIAFITAIMGEFKIYPLSDTIFRLGLGSITFFFFILFFNAKPLLTGIFTSLFVFTFRSCIDFISSSQTMSDIVINNLPSALYYLIFALCLHFLTIEQLKDHPLQLGIFGALIELISNLGEHLLHILFSDLAFITWKQFFLLVVIALIRSFFVIGIYSSLQFKQQQKKKQDLLTTQTNLYTETLYIEETANLVEQITADSFALYKNLRAQNPSLAPEILRIASEMHEVKKNTQRVVAGLANIIEPQQKTFYTINQLLSYAINSHIPYSIYLKKNIEFILNGKSKFSTTQYLALISIFNNILSNAVEAIEHEGIITITLLETDTTLSFTITNNGPSIPETNIDVLFDAGFTTKFNAYGQASTGIGLYHVKSIVHSLNGEISVDSNDLTTFHIEFNKQFL